MGPLQGIQVLEFSGLGPAPFAAMMLADMGAEVLSVERASGSDLGIRMDLRFQVLKRGRRNITLDLKSVDGLRLARRLVAGSHALIEGFRPGVMERIGLGPEDCLNLQPRLVYGRMTGWGREGPMAMEAGHDINYLGMTGALHAIGRADAAPVPPLSLVGDYGGGGMMLAFGLVCALHEAGQSGCGQVVDASVLDGVAALLSSVHGYRAAGLWSDQRADNMIDSGAPWYDTYRTRDGKFVAVGAIEDRFYANLLQVLGLAEDALPDRRSRASWPILRKRFAEKIVLRTRDEWGALAEGRDACLTPVLALSEATQHPQARARGSYIEIDGVVQARPAPRFSRTEPDRPSAPAQANNDLTAVLTRWGLCPSEIGELNGTATQAASPQHLKDPGHA
ncbi:MAG: CaiB/BaiF CoA-transferase family protein [Burkholderiaceae bacterium]|nr:CaiB/BaiF CoA-transferase family protein [Burkholderiaceae bacterium]MDO9088682.1 CaiB/BaiF CoA-transferase family protein [Burkholderiaceae bacterium]